MKLTVLLMTIVLLQVRAAGHAQTVTLSKQNISLARLFKEIGKQTGYTFLYTEEQLSHARTVNLDVKSMPLEEALDLCFRNQPLTYAITDKIIVVKRRALSGTETAVRETEIRGTVRDEKGEPLPGVTIQVKGTSKGVVTNGQGNFLITVTDDNAILVVSSIGFDRQEIALAGRKEIIVTLTASASKMNELVVVGYGEQRKATLSNSITTVSSKEFEDQPVNRFDQVLQGRAAGVQVTNPTGAPGGSVRIRIRGSNSINGDNSPLYVVDGFIGAEFFAINPDDIASIQVLKDASATAIYGSRGANGVVIVTTKKGLKDGLKVNFTSRLSSSEVIKKMDLLNAGDFAQVANEHATAVGTTPPFTAEQIADFRAKGGTDWQDEIFRTAMSQEHMLSLNGGNDKTGYFISGNYLDQDGVIENSSYKRYTLRSNINSQLSKKISTFLNITGSYSSALNVDIPADGTISPLAQAFIWSPTVPVRTAAGGYTLKDPVSSAFNNPVAITEQRKAVTDRMMANMIGGFKYDDIVPGLAFSIQYGANYLGYENKNFTGKPINNNVASASYRSNKEVRLQNTNMLNYRRTFNKVHSLDVTAVLEYQQSTYNYVSAGSSNLSYESLEWNNLAQGTPGTPGSGYSKAAIFSQVGRINYAYKDKYLVSAATRRDGSSKFAENNRFGNFPSFSAGWVLSEEPFIRDLNIFSNLKLRGSWGLTGSDAIAAYSTFSAYASRNASFTNSSHVTGIAIGNIGNLDLQWETTEQKNAGLEIGVMNGRINLTAEYFVKDTRDLLLNETLPLYLGGNTITRNVGSVQNKGWEFSVDAVVVDKGKWSWNSWMNFSFLKNNVVSVGSREMILDQNRKIGGGMSPQPEFVVRPGESLGAIWGLTYLGTWKPSEADAAAEFGAVPGDSKYLDRNGDNTIGADDYEVIGSGIPKTSFGWNNTVSHGAFSLNVFFQGLFGFDKLNYNNAATMYHGGDAREATNVDIKDRYIPGVNETSDIPAFSTTNKNFTQSTRFLEKADFLRLKNISLSYSIAKSKLWNTVGVKVFVGATNLFTITKYSGIDPEASAAAGDTRQGIDYGSYPNTKTITGGVTVSF
ncbi:TonB-dependent receptor [Chitinophaga cymbidii]|nr:TonB-dependent receptor [Chitinophaga cymbidii]